MLDFFIRPPISSRFRFVVIGALLFLSAALATAPLFAQRSASRGYRGQAAARGAQPHATAPGRYRSQGQYRGSHVVRSSKTTYRNFNLQPNRYYRPYEFDTQSPAFRDNRKHYQTPTVYAPSYPGYVTVLPFDADEAPRREPEVVERIVEVPVAQPQPIYIVMQPPAAQPAPRVAQAPPPLPKPQQVSGREPGRLRLTIKPQDAEVYLNDVFLGTGSEISALENSLRVASGVHVLQVIHPEHASERLVFGVGAQALLQFDVDLTASRSVRRSQVGSTEGVIPAIGGR